MRPGLPVTGTPSDRSHRRDLLRPGRVQQCQHLARIAGMVGVCLGLSVLAGWVLNIETFTRVAPGLVSMKVNTAVCFSAAGLALALVATGPVGGARQGVVASLALLMITVGAATLAEWWGGWDFGIDQMFVREDPFRASPSLPGRMSATSACNFVLLGGALLCLDRRKHFRPPAWISGSLSLVVMLITLLAFIGYFYSVEGLSARAPFSSIALHSTIGFLIVGGGLLLSRPDRGWMAVFVSDSAGGYLARRVLPGAILIPVILGGVTTAGERIGYFGTGFGAALLVTVLITVFTLLTWLAARSIDKESHERQRTELALRGSEERYRAFITQSSEAIWRFEFEEPVRVDASIEVQMDRAFRFGYLAECNDATARLYGFESAEQIVGARLTEFLDPKNAENFEYVRSFIISGYRLTDAESVETDRHGRTLRFLNNLVGIIEDGILTRVWGTQRDITRRKEAEEVLRESERRHQFLNALNDGTRGLSEATDIMAVSTRLLGQHLKASRCAYADVEHDTENFTIQHDYTDGCPSTTGRYTLSPFGTRARTEMREGRTLVIRDVDREMAPEDGAEMFNAIGIKAIVCCPLLKQERLRAMMAVHQSEPRDWTADEIRLVEDVVERCWSTIERARAEGALRESERFNRTLIESGRDCIQVLTLEGKVLWNSATGGHKAQCQALFSQKLGKPWIELWPDEHRPAALAALNSAAQGNPGNFVGALPVSGQARWWDVLITPILSRSGQAERLLVVSRDVTESKLAEQALQAVKDQLAQHARQLEQTVAERTARLEETVQELEAFSYSIAHDMRAPLRSMQGFANLLAEDYGNKLDESAHLYLSRISASANRLDRLIQDVLHYSKIVRGELSLEPVDIDRLVREIIASYPNLSAYESGISVEGPLPPVLGNAAALTQVFSNLLGNAVKFVEAGDKPTVRVRAESGESQVRIWVEDRGIGIPRESQARIFQMFQRLHGAEAYSGTGIGLTIVRKAVERMGGRLGVQSEPGQGSRFWFELPTADTSPQDTEP